MNDPHVTAIATIVQDALLVLNAGLIAWYLVETRKMRKAAESQLSRTQDLVATGQSQVDASLLQAEAAFRPAVVVRSGSIDAAPIIENIGNGPAIDLRWTLKRSEFSGVISYLKPAIWQSLPIDGMKPVYIAAGNQMAGQIQCIYRSVSGRWYSSMNIYDVDHDRMTTTFTDWGTQDPTTI